MTSDPAASVSFLQSSLEDLNEEQLLDKFLLDGCGCRFGPNGTQCCAFLDRSVISKCREDCLQLESSELDLVVLSCIQSHLCLPDQQTQHVSHHPTKYNSQTRSEYYFRGVRICQSTFIFVYGLSHSRYERLVKNCKQVGLCSQMPCHIVYYIMATKDVFHQTRSTLMMLIDSQLSW